MISKVLKHFKGLSWTIIAPLLVVSISALALYILGTIPGHIDSSERGVREYDSIEEAEFYLGFDIAIPAYFPNYLSWPPVSILGQSEPVHQSQITFLAADLQNEALVISQVISNEKDLPISLPWVDTIMQKTPTTVNGNEGKLIKARKSNGELVNGIYWKINDMYYVIITTHPAEEAVKLAQSIHP